MAGRRIKVLGLVLGGLAALVVLLLAGAWIGSRSDAFRGWLKERIQSEVLQATGARLELSGLEGSLLFDAAASKISLTRGGKTLLAVERLELSYNPLALLGGRVRVLSLKAVRPRVNLPWDLPAGQGGGLPPSLSLSHVSITHGSLSAGQELGPLRSVQELELNGRLSWDHWGLTARARVNKALVGLEGQEQPLAVVLGAGLERGRLKVDELKVSQGANRLVLSGEVQLKEPYRIIAQLKAPHLEVAALPFAWPLPARPAGPLALELKAEGPWQKLTMDGALKLGPQAVSFSGTLAPDSGALALGGHLTKIELASWGAPIAAGLEGDWHLKSQAWPGTEGSRPELTLALSRASHEKLNAGPIKLEAVLEEEAVLVKSLALSAPWGRLAGQGRVELPGQDRPLRLQGEMAFAGLKPPVSQAAMLPAWAKEAVLNGKATAQGALENLTFELKLGQSSVSPEMEITSLEAAGELQGQSLRLERLKLESPLAQLEARGRVARDTLSLWFRMHTPEMAALNRALSQAKISPPVALSGSLRAQGRISGPWARPDLRVRLTAGHLLSRHALARQVLVEADLKQLGPRPRGWASLAAAGVISGEIFLKQLAARAEFSGEAGSLVVQAEGPDTGLALRLESRDLLKLPLKARLSKGWIRRGRLGRWEQRGRAWVRLGSDQIRVRGLELSQGEESVKLDGDFQPVSGEVSAKLSLHGILLSRLLGAHAGLPPQARVQGEAQAGGLLSQPRLSLQGQVSGLAWPGMEPTRLEFRGRYEYERLNIAGQVYYGSRQVMEMEGRAGLTVSLRPPVWEPNDEGIWMKAAAEELPLALAAPLIPGLEQIKGTGRLELKVEGSFDRPLLGGHLSIKGGGFTVSTSGQIVKDLEMEVELERSRLRIQRASAQSEGELKLTGGLILPLGGPGGLDLHLTSQDLLVVLGTLGNFDATADVRLGGDFERPVLTGRVGVSDIVVRYGLAQPEGMSDIVILKPGQKPPPLEKKDKRFILPPRLAGLKVELDAVLGKPTRVNLDDGWLDATGGLHLSKEPDQPLIFSGQVRVTKGLVIVADKRFEVVEGTVDFQGKDQPDPALSAEARMQMGATTVFINIAGTAQDPSLQLSSLPPMTQADILSVIIFGRPAAELNQGQSKELSAQALALLGQAGKKEMSRLFGPDLSPDVVTVHNAPSAGPSLEAGKYLNEDLYLRYRQNLGPYGGQNVGLEYRFTRYFSVESTVGNTRDNGMDLVFTRDFNFSDQPEDKDKKKGKDKPQDKPDAKPKDETKPQAAPPRE